MFNIMFRNESLVRIQLLTTYYNEYSKVGKNKFCFLGTCPEKLIS